MPTRKSSRVTTRQVFIGINILGCLGLLIAIVLSIIEGVKYRIREDQGLDPIWAPYWVARLTEVWVALFLIALVASGLIGIGVLFKRRRSTNVLSIIAIITGFVLPVAGIITGIIALIQIKKTGQAGQGLAVAGITVGAATFLIVIFAIVPIVLAVSSPS